MPKNVPGLGGGHVAGWVHHGGVEDDVMVDGGLMGHGWGGVQWVLS